MIDGEVLLLDFQSINVASTDKDWEGTACLPWHYCPNSHSNQKSETQALRPLATVDPAIHAHLKASLDCVMVNLLTPGASCASRYGSYLVAWPRLARSGSKHAARLQAIGQLCWFQSVKLMACHRSGCADICAQADRQRQPC